MLVDDVSTVLHGLNIDDQTINNVLNLLEEGEGIQPKNLGRVADADYGNSDSAAQLAFHADLAHQVLVKALEDMVAGFTGLSENVRGFRKHATDVDDGTNQVITKGTTRVTDLPTIQASGDCTSSPTAAGSTCSIPNGS